LVERTSLYPPPNPDQAADRSLPGSFAAAASTAGGDPWVTEVADKSQSAAIDRFLGEFLERVSELWLVLAARPAQQHDP
jgi:hypothetical protein